MVMEHLKLEKEMGEEMHPAFAGLRYAKGSSKKEHGFCESLSCLAGDGVSAGQLDW